MKRAAILYVVVIIEIDIQEVIHLWYEKNACLWLNGKVIHVLKTQRTWYGSVAFRQGHTAHERRWPLDWSGRSEGLTKYLPELLARYGLNGWHLKFLLGGPEVLFKHFSLGTSDAKEADALIADAGLLNEEGEQYRFEAACPVKGDDGLYDWKVLAYPSNCLEALCKACSDAGTAVESIELVPSFFGRLQPKGDGLLTFQEADERRCHTVYLTDGVPLVYEIDDEALPVPAEEGTAAFLWQPDGGEKQILQPDSSVRRLMEEYELTQATAALALL